MGKVLLDPHYVSSHMDQGALPWVFPIYLLQLLNSNSVLLSKLRRPVERSLLHGLDKAEHRSDLATHPRTSAVAQVQLDKSSISSKVLSNFALSEEGKASDLRKIR